jgi:glycosyltransferase involved in cell wall biosynthesis
MHREMHKLNPTVGVVIPTYNRSKLVVQAVDSMLQQTRPPEDVVVVDDGSPDDTAAVLTAYGDRIRYLRQANAGRPTALNHGLAALETDYVWIMDDDDLAMPDALERHLALLNAHPEIDFTFSGNYVFQGDAPPSTLPPERLVECPDPGDAEFFIRVLIWFRFYMQSMLVPRECYREVGPFDESLGFNDDYDMILRLARRFRGGKLAKPAFMLREHSGARGPAHERRALAEREATFREYDKKILSKLRRELSLEEYLPRGTAERPLNARQTREALLQRAGIMARHELFDAAFADIDAALAERGGDELTPREQQLFSHMLNVDHWWLKKHRQFPSRMGKFLRERRAWPALESCAIGLGWRIAQERRSGRYRNAFEMADQLRRLTGIGRLPGVARMALRRRSQSYAGQERSTASSPS